MVSVVVFRDRAQVTREASADCTTGRAVFAGLPSTLDPRTLLASLRGKGKVLGLTRQEQASGPRPEAATLQKKIRGIDDRLARHGERVAAVGAAERKMRSFQRYMGQVWARQATGERPPVDSWTRSLDLLRSRSVAERKRRRQAQARSRQLNRRRAELKRRLALIQRKRRRTTLRVTALLRCQGRPRVQLSYVVPGAGWQISYQLRAHPARGRVALRALASVRQGTGEDWPSVALSVSTANLQRSNLPPAIRRLAVTSSEPRETQKVLSRRVEQRRRLQAQTPGTAAPAAPPVGLAMQLPAAARVTVPGDGREVQVVLAREELAADVSLETVPKLYPYVYRKLRLANPFAFTMLAGTVDVFSGHAFLGRAQVQQRAPGEPLSFSLGVQNQIQVKRYVKQERHAPPGALDSYHRLVRRYVIQVGNWTHKPQRVKVLENLPVARVKEIRVKLGDDASRPDSWRKQDGILGWTLDLPPRSKKEVTLSYVVEVPKEYLVSGF
jgi:uncharacterized protein (TIGR02231 family)